MVTALAVLGPGGVLLAVLGSLAVPVAIVWLIVRKTSADTRASAVPIARQNDVLKAVGLELGLAYADASGGYGMLRGERHGVAVAVQFAFAYQAHSIQIVGPGRRDQRASARRKFQPASVRYADHTLIVEPVVDKLKAGWTAHYVILDPAVLRRWIDDVASFAATS